MESLVYIVDFTSDSSEYNTAVAMLSVPDRRPAGKREHRVNRRLCLLAVVCRSATEYYSSTEEYSSS